MSIHLVYPLGSLIAHPILSWWCHISRILDEYSVGVSIGWVDSHAMCFIVVSH
jgi:hypothetical protein